MAKFKRKADTEFDVDRPVVVCAKGPSFEFFKDFHFPDSYLASITTTANFIEEPIDFLFFNDIEAFKQIEKDKFDNVSNVICPLSLHEKFEPSTEYTCSYVKVELEDKDLNIFTHRLYTQDFDFQLDPKEQDLFSCGFLTPHSTLDTAVAWFISLGFYKFIFFGVSPEAGYSKDFEDVDKKKKAWYGYNFYIISSLLKSNGCKAVLMTEDKTISTMNCGAQVVNSVKFYEN